MTEAGDDSLNTVVGDASTVRDAFDQVPVLMISLAGPDLRIAAANGAFRAFLGRAGLIGLRVRDVLPGVAGEQLAELLGRAYAAGRSETWHQWPVQLNRGRGQLEQAYIDLTVQPWWSGGKIIGLLGTGADVTARALGRQAPQPDDADAERRYPDAVTVTMLQEALLPATLPVLPQARIAAQYLAAGHQQAGGDWFDALALPDGTAVLVVGDAVGHGIAAVAAMAQLRAVLSELVCSGDDLPVVLARIDRFAASRPTVRAATLALAALDPAVGTLRYATCGHPPPLVVGAGGTTRFLPVTRGGPLGTGSAHRLATDVLDPGELVVLYTDGLTGRPGQTTTAELAELAGIATRAAASPSSPASATATPPDRVARVVAELLARAGDADDATALAAERLAAPLAPLHLELPSQVRSLPLVRRALRDWLEPLGLLAEDADGVHMAVVETVTNVIEHAYPAGHPGPFEFDMLLHRGGELECRITDYGSWRSPDPAAADRGNGLMVAEHMVDEMLVSHPARQPGAGPGAAGTVVTLLHRISRPAGLALRTGQEFRPARPVVPFAVDARLADGLAGARVRGPVDAGTADEFLRRMLAACRGGTLPLTADLTEVSLLASAGVSALYRLSAQLARNGSQLDLVAADGSAVQAVLELVGLTYTIGEPGLTQAREP
jgi:serine phosphatase RsbU (regulator of sigma subunit)/anti-sigma regulatory factor (Ser/Thr protein kinase)/anti-anti-sigma regulatory factor